MGGIIIWTRRELKMLRRNVKNKKEKVLARHWFSYVWCASAGGLGAGSKKAPAGAFRITVYRMDKRKQASAVTPLPSKKDSTGASSRWVRPRAGGVATL